MGHRATTRRTNMPSSTVDSKGVADPGDAVGAIAAAVNRERFAREEEPYARCDEHGQFEGACIACWYKKKYPYMCSAA
jgi:hypothetical protein